MVLSRPVPRQAAGGWGVGVGRTGVDALVERECARGGHNAEASQRNVELGQTAVIGWTPCRSERGQKHVECLVSAPKTFSCPQPQPQVVALLRLTA